MEYKRFRQKILLHLNPGEEAAEYIREVCRTEKVVLGKVSGLGAVSEAEPEVFDTMGKRCYGKSFKDNYETAPLMGNIAQQGENSYLYLHMVIGSPLVGECHGGHLNRAVISATAEIFIMVVDGTAGRRVNESIGLNLIGSIQVQYRKRHIGPDCPMYEAARIFLLSSLTGIWKQDGVVVYLGRHVTRERKQRREGF